ncbi:hypothetical protein EON67_11250 [archaeon]|nr:MAG: hypothetical protein EON67_11250 [archaeon]
MGVATKRLLTQTAATSPASTFPSFRTDSLFASVSYSASYLSPSFLMLPPLRGAALLVSRCYCARAVVHRAGTDKYDHAPDRLHNARKHAAACGACRPGVGGAHWCVGIASTLMLHVNCLFLSSAHTNQPRTRARTRGANPPTHTPPCGVQPPRAR